VRRSPRIGSWVGLFPIAIDDGKAETVVLTVRHNVGYDFVGLVRCMDGRDLPVRVEFECCQSPSVMWIVSLALIMRLIDRVTTGPVGQGLMLPERVTLRPPPQFDDKKIDCKERKTSQWLAAVTRFLDFREPGCELDKVKVKALVEVLHQTGDQIAAVPADIPPDVKDWICNDGVAHHPRRWGCLVSHLESKGVQLNGFCPKPETSETAAKSCDFSLVKPIPARAGP